MVGNGIEKRSLNTAQKEAVEYTAGPLLIVAGAGTGKTMVITEKIARLVETGCAKPEEILALTFTDKAAKEMHDRVDILLDTGYADLQISTFHAFAERLLEEHGLEIGLPNRFTLMTDTDAWMLLREHIYTLPLEYYRPLGNPARHIHELLRHFSKCKDELITPEAYLAYAQRVTLDSDEAGESERSRLHELANAYHTYQQLLLEHTALDFGDLIAYSVRLLEERPMVRERLQKRFAYILIDEFQDVNWAQYQLAKLLAGHGKLTVVGDDDQAIYAFRGASVSNILRFKEDFPNAKEVVLTENYRSGQKILDHAYTLIQKNNPDRLEAKLKIDKRLSAASSQQPAVVECIRCPTLDQEVQAVVEKIVEIKNKVPDATWDDFAILIRANSHAEPFLSAFERHGIPYEFLASSGLYRQPIILDCVNFFTTITDHLDSTALYRILRMPCVDLGENDFQRLVYAAKKQSLSYYETMKRAQEFRLSDGGVTAVEKLLHALHEGMKQARFEKPTVVLYHFLDTTGYLSYLTHEEGRGNARAIRSIYHLKQFFDFLARFESVVPEASVTLFAAHMENLIDAGSEGKLYQPSETPDSINVLTVHSAKGLEFRFVFVVNLVEDRFPTRRRGEGIEMPKELIKERLPEGDYHLEEERRLFYVAVTRAKERLYLTSAEDYGGMRAKKTSRFLAEMRLGETSKNAPKLSTIDHRPRAGSRTLRDYRLSADGRKREADNRQDAHGFVYELPKTFSFSQIKAYETCPYQYKLAHILHIPTRGNASFSFGKTIHSTLQHFYERVQELNASKQESLFLAPSRQPNAESLNAIRVPQLADLLKLYEECWIPDWYESKHQRELYYKKGREILKIFYASQIGNWTVPLGLETGFTVKIGDVLLRGQMDRIDQLTDKTIEIVDYKTGKSKEKLESADKEQLLMYQIAVESLPQYRNLGAPGKLTFYYVNDNVQVSFLGRGEELEKLKAKIMDTVSLIRDGDFTATPSPYVCGHCDFRDICEFRIL